MSKQTEEKDLEENFTLCEGYDLSHPCEDCSSTQEDYCKRRQVEEDSKCSK